MYRLHLILILLLVFNVSFGNSDLQSLLDKAEQSQLNRSYQDAIQLYHKALDINKKCAKAHLGLASSYMKLLKFEEAIKYSNSSLKHKTQDYVQAVLLKAEAYNQLGKPHKSCGILESAIEKYDEPYQLTYKLAHNYFELGDIEAAEAFVLKSISKNDQYAKSHLLLSYLYRGSGETEKALSGTFYCLLFEKDTERSKLIFQSLLQDLGRRNLGEPDAIVTKEQFEEETMKYFDAIGTNQSCLYARFLNELATTQHFETYCNWISRGHSSKAAAWIESESLKVVSMNSWVALK